MRFLVQIKYYHLNNFYFYCISLVEDIRKERIQENLSSYKIAPHKYCFLAAYNHDSRDQNINDIRGTRYENKCP
jgi:hypothetical protein